MPLRRKLRFSEPMEHPYAIANGAARMSSLKVIGYPFCRAERTILRQQLSIDLPLGGLIALGL
jgi:hypothetical protein